MQSQSAASAGSGYGPDSSGFPLKARRVYRATQRPARGDSKRNQTEDTDAGLRNGRNGNVVVPPTQV